MSGTKKGIPGDVNVATSLESAKLASMKLILHWLLNAAALLCVAYLYQGVRVGSFGAALLAAFVIGLFNMVLRPVLVLLTLPVTQKISYPST